MQSYFFTDSIYLVRRYFPSSEPGMLLIVVYALISKHTITNIIESVSATGTNMDDINNHDMYNHKYGKDLALIGVLNTNDRALRKM